MKQNTVAVPTILEFNGKLVKTKVFDIGVWNMDVTNSIQIAHNCVLSKIVSISAVIINDLGDYVTPIDYSDFVAGDAGRVDIDAVNIVIGRRLAGMYDHVDYDDGVINRGYVLIMFYD